MCFPAGPSVKKPHKLWSCVRRARSFILPLVHIAVALQLLSRLWWGQCLQVGAIEVTHMTRNTLPCEPHLKNNFNMRIFPSPEMCPTCASLFICLKLVLFTTGKCHHYQILIWLKCVVSFPSLCLLLKLNQPF